MTRAEELRVIALDRARADMSGRPPSEMLALARGVLPLPAEPRPSPAAGDHA